MSTLPRFVLGLALVSSFAAASHAAPGSAQVFTTAANTPLRLTPEAPLIFAPATEAQEGEPALYINPKITFQTLVGIGGALTDSSAEVFDKLPKATQEEFLTALFDKEKGVGYTLARTSIASCDFSSDTYAYVKDGDASLASFSVAHDEKHRIPFIKAAIAAAGGSLPLFASPWSPPAWMKTNGSVLHGGKLKPEFRDAWARHYVAFVRAYEAHDIPVWGLTVQNEPLADQTWESCQYSAEEERDFVRDHLGPTLAKAGLGGLKLIGWDHNRELTFQRASVLYGDPEAAKYLWGVGVHWYETWTGGPMQFEVERRVAEAYPEKHVIFTEGCKEGFAFNKLDDWTLGERYGNSLLNDFNSGVCAWSDWNVLLDETGGPNHVNNLCFAPVHADLRTGKLIYTNAYHYIGHFSKFLRPGAKRVAATSNRNRVLTTAFVNTDGSVVVVALNQSDEDQKLLVWLEGVNARTVSRAHSIMTFVVN